MPSNAHRSNRRALSGDRRRKDIDYETTTLEEHLRMGMGSAWLKPKVRELVIKLLREDAREQLAILRRSLDGHTYARKPSDGEYYANMTDINRLLHRLEKAAATPPPKER